MADSKKNISNSTNSQENVYSMWDDQERSEKGAMRASIVVAILVHLALLIVTFPQLYTEELTPAGKPKVLVLSPTPKWKKPPPPPTDPLPPKRALKVPVPDPDPQAVEPFVSDEELAAAEITLDEYDTIDIPIPEAPPPFEPELVLAGGQIERPQRLHYVEPRYTEIARRTRTQGIVILETTLDQEGRVGELRVLRGLPMGLTEEAIRAVEQWVYEPSTYNGRPVSVLMTVTVHFKLQ